MFWPMARRYFTVGEVERLIPKLEKIFVQVLQLRTALRGQEQILARAGIELSSDALEREDPRESPNIRRAKGLFRAYYDTLSDELGGVGKLGGEVKDLELGLVDFPGKRGGEDILLCWRLGEREIAHWHSVDSGYSSRRPIDDQVPRERPPLD